MIGVGRRPAIRGHESKNETTSTNLGWIAEASIYKEPGAGLGSADPMVCEKPHAGICAGGGSRVTGCPTLMHAPA